MSTAYVTLRPFAENELIFDETETKDILKFFFLHLRERIDTVSMTTELRNFAQGLLVEAIDATYALGYLEILFRASYNRRKRNVESAFENRTQGREALVQTWHTS